MMLRSYRFFVEAGVIFEQNLTCTFSACSHNSQMAYAKPAG